MRRFGNGWLVVKRPESTTSEAAMWGIAFSLNPMAWRFGKRDAVDGGIVVGVWWCFGPVAICYDYE
ncbi:hypothetical protein [Brevundimonas vesicularis]|uniref:Uncharacterized protein n=1 Tax=Brevundimonas vesicularis TaxID=41276 RepID=A0ABU4KP92_BREVE|nr:hypothetical protein [Brevundimonas vesicularis]MDX2334597.1 hypothetical protein [Brevundimonas vesicularis]